MSADTTTTGASATWLPSWTRTLNEAEALTLLDLAKPGLTIAQWKAEAHESLPQGGRARRLELLKLVRDDLLDVVGETIVESPFLRLVRDGSPHRRRALLLARHLARRPLVARALADLVRPALLRFEAPLSPVESDQISRKEWDRWLYSVLRPGIPLPAFEKSRSTLQTALANAGSLSIAPNRARLTRATRGEPDPLAWAWALADELNGGRAECDEVWAMNHSFPALLFAQRPEAGASAIDAGIAAGILHRSFLAGRARILPVND